jgi:NAD(P)-dependent dehydrogenase (short-subunit alcohol dehydrogenase family)
LNKQFNPFTLSGKKFLITGAASGIGQATSILLSKLGADLILLDINLAGLNETKSGCKKSDVIIEYDLRNTAEIKNILFAISEKHGFINGFVHLAGIPYISPLKSISESKYEEVMRVNTIAALEIAKAFNSKKVSGDNGSSIVFISSVYALVGSVANVGYAMSKAALHGITKSLAIELAPKKIRVNCIAPGFIKTKMKSDTDKLFSADRDELLESLHPLGLGDVDDVAYACAFLLSDAGKWITGSIMNVDGGFTAK